MEDKKEEKKEDKKEEKKEEEKKKESEDEEEKEEAKDEQKKKKKKKKHKKKKKKDANKLEEGPRENPYREFFKWDQAEVNNSREQDNSRFRVIGSWKEGEWSQTNYPTKDIDELFPNRDWPVGVLCDYGPSNIWRSTDKEKQELDKVHEYELLSLRKGAECHKQVRKYAQRFIKPGMKMIDICIELEKMLKFITNAHGLDSGQSFPTGCSLNDIAAHYTPNTGDETVLNYDDVCKLDFGTHINGFVIDCAFTIAFNPIYDNLLMASKEGTNTGVKLAGIDARLGEIGAGIQEVIESYEVEIKGKTHKIKAIKNLCGHTVDQYKVHAGKSVPIVKRDDNTKMEEGEMYAIETFASTGKGSVFDNGECSHYMMEEYGNPDKLKNEKAKALYHHIKNNYSTLAWCRRWLDEGGFKNHSLALKHLIDHEIVTPYPPLGDVEGCYVSQFEHTLILRPTMKEVVTIADDY